MENVVEKNTTLKNDSFDSRMIALLVVHGLGISILKSILNEFYSRDVAFYSSLTISIFILANALFFFDFGKNWLKNLLKQYYKTKFVLWSALNISIVLLVLIGFLLFQIVEALVSMLFELFNIQLPNYFGSMVKFSLAFACVISVLKLCFYLGDKIQSKS
jgi:uncharacterized protein YacL